MSQQNTKRHVICSSCNSINRVPKERWSGTAKCGACQQELDVTHSVFNVTGKTLSVIMSQSPVPVVVDFWAPWCGPCLGFAPTFESVAKAHANSALFVKLNTEADPNGGGQFGIRAIPTLIVFSEGKEKARMSGALPTPQFVQWLSQNGVAIG